METKPLELLSKEELIALVRELRPECVLMTEGEGGFVINYKSLVEEASDVIFIIDQSGNLVYQNVVCREFFSRGNKNEIGKHYLHYLPEVEHERAQVVFNAVLTEGKSVINEKMKTVDKDGNIHYFIANFTPIREMAGKIVGMLAVLRDITAIHKMEKMLKENSRRLEEKVKEQIEQAEELKRLKALNDEIVNNAPIGIFLMDPVGIMLTENPALKRIMGHPPNVTRVGYNLFQHPGFIEAGLKDAFDKVLLEKRSVTMRNTRYVPISGDRVLTINVTMDPIFDSKRNVKNVLVMVEDVTEQSLMAEKMQRIEKLSAMGLLAAGVAYEMKMPLNLITMNLNFIEKNIDKDSPVIDYINDVKEELIKMRNITNQLLNLAKPEEEEKEILTISKVLESHPIQLVLKRMKEKGYEVETYVAPNTPMVKATMNHLVQVLLHLISNAEDAMPEGGKLTISVSRDTVGEHPVARISVADTGIGIPEENLTKIFQPFFTTKGQKATGLGLMVTYSIVENMGGAIGIRSKVGEGTEVRILLPGEQ
ncbi:MAG: PAS domain S-box protein [Spirochaetes bacterium]|nr:PAS domain S-box protein [Spirochaetota bacterium]